MSPIKPFIRHIAISFVVLFVLLGILFISLSSIRGVIAENLRNAASDSFTPRETLFAMIALPLIVVVILISYITYLLLARRSREEVVIWEATEKLALSREQFKMLYDDAPVPYITLDKKGLIREPNKAALRFFGVLPEEIEGKNLFIFHPDDEKDHADRLRQRYVNNIAINKEEIRMINKNGDERIVRLSIFETRNLTHMGRMGIAAIDDITEEKKLDQAKTEFVSLASHQLRSPLATMKWFMDMLFSGDIGELAPKPKEYVTKLYTVNSEMISLVETLLNVSRIEIGTLPVEKKETRVEELSESILVELAAPIAKKNLHIERNYNGALEHVATDPKLLRIVIQNLISNAVKYTPEGGGIAIAFEEIPGKSIITVADTGLGIPLEEQNKIFTKLFRANNVKKESASQGTGLGLYLVKSIVETLGGVISFVSEENKGSVFTITLTN